MELDVEAAAKLHRDALTVLERAVELRGVSNLFASTAALPRTRKSRLKMFSKCSIVCSRTC